MSVIAFLYLVGLGVVWLRDFSFSKETDPTSRQIATVRLFFSNSEQDPDALDCGAVFPVSRELPPNPSLARIALTELLKGPTEKESVQGFYSSINEGVRLLGLDIRDGVATIDFDGTFAAGVAGSCRVEAIRAQVTQTLVQFSSVHSVVITVAGEISESFQP